MPDPIVISGEVGAAISAVVLALFGGDKLLQRRKNQNGGAPMTKELCNERTQRITEGIERIEHSIEKIEKKIG